MLNPDYRDMLSAFADAGVEYLLVGAYALAVHGQPRATGDMVLWVRPTRDNAERVLRAFRQFGAPLSGVRRDDIEQPDLVIQIGVSPRRIDVITSIDGVAFDEAWRDRRDLQVEGVRVSVLSREHLIRNKRALGRTQDLADVERLESAGEDEGDL